MTKEEAIKVFGGGSSGIIACAKALRITRHAIYQWRTAIPRRRELEIYEIFPALRGRAIKK